MLGNIKKFKFMFQIL